MFGIGTTELIVILVVALIVVGPKKLPQIARTLGKAMGEFKRVSTDLHRTINTEVELQERKEREKEEKKKKLAEKKTEEDAATDKAAPAEKSEEDIAAEKAYESAVAANTPVTPEETGATEAASPDMASVEEDLTDKAPVIDVRSEDVKETEAEQHEAAEKVVTTSAPAGEKA